MGTSGLNIKEYKNNKKRQRGPQQDRATRWLEKEIFKRDKVPNKVKEIFYLELSSMLDAGMDIKESMDIIIDQQEKKPAKSIFEKIKHDLIEGYSLAGALKKSGHFTPYEYFCVQIGEESGKLIEVLTQLASYFSNKLKLRRQIWSSLSYPIVIMITSIIAVIFMLTFVVPMFSDIFKRFDAELPFLTQVFINASFFFKQYFIGIFVFILVVVVAVISIWNNDTFTRKRQFLLIKIPYVKELAKGIYLSRFCSSMALMTSARIPLLQAINLAKQMISFYPISIPLEHMEEDIMKGKSLHHCLSKDPIFDKKMISLLKVGEDVNKLDLFFDKLYHHYSDDINVKTSTFNTFLEPLIIVFLGAMIGVLLIAMYLPMFKLSTSIH